MSRSSVIRIFALATPFHITPILPIPPQPHTPPPHPPSTLLYLTPSRALELRPPHPNTDTHTRSLSAFFLCIPPPHHLIEHRGARSHEVACTRAATAHTVEAITTRERRTGEAQRCRSPDFAHTPGSATRHTKASCRRRSASHFFVSANALKLHDISRRHCSYRSREGSCAAVPPPSARTLSFLLRQTPAVWRRRQTHATSEEVCYEQPRTHAHVHVDRLHLPPGKGLDPGVTGRAARAVALPPSFSPPPPTPSTPLFYHRLSRSSFPCLPRPCSSVTRA